jgi:hypothetical protein
MADKPKKRGRPKTVIDDTTPLSILRLCRELGVGKASLTNALANVKPSGTGYKGDPAWTKPQAMAALQASGSKAGGGTLQAQKISEQIRKLKLENDHQDRILVERVQVAETIARIGSRFAAIRTHEEGQAGIHLVGKSINEIRDYIRDLFDRVGGVLRDAGEEWK